MPTRYPSPRFTDGVSRVRWMTFIEYADRSILFRSLAQTIATELEQAASTQGFANLAVPGGTTPAPFFEQLNRIDLAWTQINVTLTDERLVAEDHERSNARLLKNSLLQHNAAPARFTSLYANDQLVSSEVLATLKPLTSVVLGMGTDGHTASLFPQATELLAALDPTNPALSSVIHAPNVPEPRITLTWSLLSTAQHLHLLITGEEKKAVLQQALSSLTDTLAMPVRVVLQQAVTVHYAP